MAFTDLNLRKTYNTFDNNIVKEFYVPVLKESVLYQRSVGYFSSTALIEFTKGISGLVKNKGKIQLIVSPYLSEEDVLAIQTGYDIKKKIEEALINKFRTPQNHFQEERLNLLAHLIEDGYLDIKVAFTLNNQSVGMYHEKVGIMTDQYNNKVAFTGSPNETANALYNNYESMVVFDSWSSSQQYVEELQEGFDSLWNSKKKNLEILEFPNVLISRIKQYKKDSYNFDLDEFDIKSENYFEKEIKVGIPRIPAGRNLRDYQKDAIEKWKDNSYRGIFDMATGTGKTYTGLGAITKLYEDKKRLAIIIVCPYQHLVEQWVEDIELFNLRPIIGYSDSKQKDWRKRLDDDIWDFSIGIIDCICFVTTNATYSSLFVCQQMARLGKDTLLLIDEAHNFGSPNLCNKLYSSIEYRLALSATLERYGDEEGTNCLKKYFGEKCIEYDIQRAIKEGMLTPYYYYPIVVYLDENEIDKYRDISYLISKECYKDKQNNYKITEKGKRLLIQRSRIIAGAKSKITELKKQMQKYKNDTHILVYCGATRLETFAKDTSENDKEGERQIVAVSKLLGLELGMKVTHFTSNESAKEREEIKKKFATADPYQAIVAIKCLDEGVNIPSIKTAFILASTTNPKEYIQRRGRVLRLAEGKSYAVIYDFVTLMKPLNETDPYSSDYNYERSLAKRELARIKEFGEISLNSRDADSLIRDIEEAYDLDDKATEEIDYESVL